MGIELEWYSGSLYALLSFREEQVSFRNFSVNANMPQYIV